MSGSTLRRPPLLVALLMVTAITGPACQGRRAPGDRLGPSVVLWQLSQDGFDLALCDSRQAKLRILYKARGWVVADRVHEPRGLYDPVVPDDLGFLPSPNGVHLLVWVPSDGASWANGEPRTRWSLITAATGAVVNLGETEGSGSLLPYWKDDEHLVFEGQDDRKTIDIGGSRRDQDLLSALKPCSSLPGAANRQRLVTYLARNHAALENVYLSALTKLEKHIQLDRLSQADAPLPREYPLLQSLGIPGLGELRNLFMPDAEITCTEGGRLLVCADNEPKRLLSIRRDIYGAPVNRTVEARGARIEVLDVASGDLLWSRQLLPKTRPGVILRGIFPSPEPYPWTSPTFRDLRFDHSGRYLSFTTNEDPLLQVPSVTVLDTTTWNPVMRIPNAMDAFVLSPLRGNP
jgi:hypothetical protein